MRYRMDYRGTRNDVLRDPGVAAHVQQRAQQGAEAARAIAPVGTPPKDPHPGLYRSSITVRGRSRMGDRYGVILTATVPYAQRLEQRYHTIASVVDVIERG